MDKQQLAEILELCENTVGLYDLADVAEMLIDEGGWEGTCRAEIIPFMNCAQEHLPALARDYGKLMERNETLETTLRDVYDWLTKNKLQYSGHGRLIESILAEGGGE